MAYSSYTPNAATTSEATDDIDLPDDSELETSGVGAFDSPLEELADRVAKTANNNRRWYSEDSTLLALCVSTAATYASGSSDPANYAFTAVSVNADDIVHVEVNVHAQCAVASAARVRLGYVITSGSVNGVAASEVRWGSLSDEVPVHLMGHIEAGSAGTMYLFLQVQSPGATNQINVYGPITSKVVIGEAST